MEFKRMRTAWALCLLVFAVSSQALDLNHVFDREQRDVSHQSYPTVTSHPVPNSQDHVDYQEYSDEETVPPPELITVLPVTEEPLDPEEQQQVIVQTSSEISHEIVTTPFPARNVATTTRSPYTPEIVTTRLPARTVTTTTRSPYTPEIVTTRLPARNVATTTRSPYTPEIVTTRLPARNVATSTRPPYITEIVTTRLSARNVITTTRPPYIPEIVTTRLPARTVVTTTRPPYIPGNSSKEEIPGKVKPSTMESTFQKSFDLMKESMLNICAKKYYISDTNETHTWHDARKNCGDIGHAIVTIDHLEKQQCLAEHFERFEGHSFKFWTSGQKVGESLTWQSTVEDFSFTSSVPGQPDSRTEDQDCLMVSFKHLGGPRVDWSKDRCDERKRFICE